MIPETKEKNILIYKGRWNVIMNKDFLLYNPDIIDIRTKHLYFTLKSFINPSTTTAFPSIEYLCRVLKWNKGTVFKHLKNLRELKLIDVKKMRGEKGLFSHNVYYIEDELKWMEKRIQNENLDN